MKHWLLPFALATCAPPLLAQQCRTRAQLIADDEPIPAYDHGLRTDSSMNELWRSTYIGDRTSGYIGLISEDAVQQHRDHPLQEGEGLNGYRFEANTDLFFTVTSGRKDPHFLLGGHRTGIYFNNTVRMAKDASSPLLPGNWKIGVAGEIPLWLSHFGDKKREWAKRIADQRMAWRTEQGANGKLSAAAQYSTYLDQLRGRNNEVAAANLRRSHSLHLHWQLYHYSNGQDTGFYDVPAAYRNDYNSGDFSTNCLQLKLVYAFRYNADTATTGANLVTVGLGTRKELGGHDGVFAFSREQEYGYGRGRLVGHVQWRTKPFWLRVRGIARLHVQRRYREEERPTCPALRLREFAEFRARVEFERIMDPDASLGHYPWTDKQRWGTHLWLELNTMRSYAVGFFAHAYYGRDYLNIRYDRVVALFMGGISFHINKYIPYGWRSAETIVP